MNDQMPDRQIIQGLWLGSSRAKVYSGQCEALLTLGPRNAVPVEDGVRHRHADFPNTIEEERALARWLGAHWSDNKTVLIRAEPILNGERICAMLLMNLGSDERQAAQLLLRPEGER